MDTLLSILFVLAVIFIVIMYSVYKGTRKAVKKGVEGIDRAKHTVRVSLLPKAVRNGLREGSRYAKLIMQAYEQCPPPQKEQLSNTIHSVNEISDRMTRLEQTADKLYRKRNVEREGKQITKEIEDLRNQLETDDEKQVRIIQRLLATKEKHLSILDRLEAFRKQVELTIRHNGSILNSTHAEMTLLSTRGALDESRFNSLNQDLQENLDGLTDLVETIEEMNV